MATNARRFAATTLVLALAATIAVGLSRVGGDGGTARAQDGARGCHLEDPQPEHPLEMNTVVVQDLIKTVVMEKEILRCPDALDRPVIIRDLETFVEVIEQRKGADIVPFDKRVEVARCDKNVETGFVDCDIRQVHLAPPTEVPIRGCEPLPSPKDPVEMNTVAVGTLAKTIKVEKELFRCPVAGTTSTTIAEVYLFTEIVERRDQHTIRPIAKRFDGIVCEKDVRHGDIGVCRPFLIQ